MAISLKKGANVSLSKEAPSVTLSLIHISSPRD